jgi:hypothetical protein
VADGRDEDAITLISGDTEFRELTAFTGSKSLLAVCACLDDSVGDATGNTALALAGVVATEMPFLAGVSVDSCVTDGNEVSRTSVVVDRCITEGNVELSRPGSPVERCVIEGNGSLAGVFTDKAAAEGNTELSLEGVFTDKLAAGGKAELSLRGVTLDRRPADFEVSHMSQT